jgi:ribose 5-phosphate isomerase B
MIYIGSDHRGIQIKIKISKYLNFKNIDNTIIGYLTNEKCDYPDIAHELINKMNDGDIGILICYTANGMSMTANKYENIRAAICWNIETAILVRQHNDANVLCIPSGYVTDNDINDNNDINDINDNNFYKIVDAFLDNDNNSRHLRRINKINIINEKIEI